jgi:hypothetical protein
VRSLEGLLKQAHPTRRLIPFARNGANDEWACFDPDRPILNEWVVIADFEEGIPLLSRGHATFGQWVLASLRTNLELFPGEL